MLVPRVSAHIDPLPPIGRQAPAPAAVIVAGIVIGRAEDGETTEVTVMEEGVMAVPAGTGKAWANRGMREARSTEAWSANMGKARTAHATYMHAAEATGVHTATEAAMSATAETTTAVTA